MSAPPYRDFYYPLNVFMHILTAEEGGVAHLHYALFDGENERIGAAQERSTELLLSRLPPPPARLLDVGAGLGTTLARLTGIGYDAEGITPDEKQIAMMPAGVRVRCIRFEDLPAGAYDTVIFQESSQYIGAEALFGKAREVTAHVVVLDEFTMGDDPAATLHRYDAFLDAAARHGFAKTEDLDLTEKAAPTIDYFNDRFPRHRRRLIEDLGLTDQQVDDLVRGGYEYRDLYRRGVYAYRLLQFRR